jgi:hypothetical protein
MMRHGFNQTPEGLLDFLAGFLEKNGYCPSYEEIADGLTPGFARDGSQAYLVARIQALSQAWV